MRRISPLLPHRATHHVQWSMTAERPPRQELDRSMVAAYAATFISRTDMFPVQLGNGSYSSVEKQLNMEIVAAHLTGSITIGAYALDAASKAKWICFDADSEDTWQGLKALAQELEEMQCSLTLNPPAEAVICGCLPRSAWSGCTTICPCASLRT